MAYTFPSIPDDVKLLVVIPCLDEAATIEPLLRKLNQQRGDMDMLIVVADGGSKDGTRQIVRRVASELADIVLIANPRRIQSAGINRAVERFGEDRDYLIRIDAHGDYPADYFRVLIEEAVAMQADSVVVGMETVGFGVFQKATAVAQNSRLGNGGSRHRANGGANGGEGGWTDHGHHALMRVEAFRAVGGYDESFSHNEDAELDFRLRKAGFRIWMTGRTHMTYYNARETLVSAIDSALAQVGVTLEVIVVDDCSTDGTRDIAEAYASVDGRVRVISLAVNGGPAAARNAGFAAARGRYIAVLDADDTVLPIRLLAMLERAETIGAQIVVDNLDVVPLDGARPQTMFAVEELKRQPMMTLADFIGSNVVFRSSFNFGYMKPVFERAFLERHGLRFDETLTIGEDYLLLASALACGGQCAVTPEPGYVYHLRNGSISRVLEHRHLDAMLEADERFLAQYQLDAPAMAAQRARTRSIIEARSFLTLVEAIKRRSPRDTLKVAMENPRALRHLRMPVAVRLGRLARTIRHPSFPFRFRKANSWIR